MKYLAIPIICILLFSCGGGDSNKTEIESKYADFSVSMDTVVVDSGDEILMAATNFYEQIISQNTDRLYFWNFKNHIVEVIDLTKMAFLEKRKFEKEGPNGVGQSPNKIIIIGDDKVAFVQQSQITIADMAGNVLSKISLDEEWMKKELDADESLLPVGFSNDGDFLYCSISNPTRLNSNFIQLDLNNEKTHLIHLPEFDKREKFRVTFKVEIFGGVSTSTTSPSLDYTPNQDKLIFWSSAFNHIYQFNPETKSVEYIKISNSLTPNEKMNDYENDVNSEEAFFKIMNQIEEEVSFSNLFWDDVNQVFYRFTSFNLPQVENEKIKSKVFISIINADFEVIGEKEITDLVGSVPKAQFVKDEKIHSFLNIDDEVGYVRIGINE